MDQQDSSSQEFYIPYKFYDKTRTDESLAFCRSSTSGKFKIFTIPRKSWLIVNPFRCEDSSVDELIESLQRVFKTSHVYHDESDLFLVNDYDLSDFNEYDFKSVTFLDDNYSINIALSKKRFYNAFSDGDGGDSGVSGKETPWTDQRIDSKTDVSLGHMFITYDSNGKHLLYRKSHGKDYQILTPKEWGLVNENIDIIFSDLTQESFQDLMNTKIQTRIDYVYVSPYWLSEYPDLRSWYEDYIEDLYQLSFMSARNMSDIVSVNSRSGWEILTDYIMLSKDISLFRSNKTNRFQTNYCIPGKYNNVYLYNIGDIQLSLLGNSACRQTVKTQRFLQNLSRWNHIISNVFNNSLLDPTSFVIPESCVYIDSQYMAMSVPLSRGYQPARKIDYMIALNEGSYLTYDIASKKSVFRGLHPLSKPLFPAVRKAIENYMLCSARRFEVNIEAITDMIDKNRSSLKIVTKITRSNLEIYRSILPEKVLEDFELGKIDSTELSTWLGKSVDSITAIYDPEVTPKTSSKFIQGILNSLDRIEFYCRPSRY